MDFIAIVRRGSRRAITWLGVCGLILTTLLTTCTTQPRTVPPADHVGQVNTPQIVPSSSSSSPVMPPSPIPSAFSQAVAPSPIPTTPTLASPAPSLIAPGSANNLSQTYTNPYEQYVVSIPPDWTVVTSDVGTAYFFSQESLDERNKGLTDWEASIGGIQFVGRNPKPTENEQYEAILPNHCFMIDWQPVEIKGTRGRIYTLDCDNPISTGMHRRQHVYLPYGNRFVEVWLNVDPIASGSPVPLLNAIVSTLEIQGLSSAGLVFKAWLLL